MEGKFTVRQNEKGEYIVDVLSPHGGFTYSTDPFTTSEIAIQKGKEWLHWAIEMPKGNAESLYYILVVPDIWPGPMPGTHPYSGLELKIGRTKNIHERIRNLQTGASGQLILHALEPGDSKKEKEIHNRFKSDRRQGEWFMASFGLCRHVMNVWGRNNLLPREYQLEIMALHNRIDAYGAMRHVIAGKPPDMVNPSVNEKWNGTVFVDLVHSAIVRGKSEKESNKIIEAYLSNASKYFQ